MADKSVKKNVNNSAENSVEFVKIPISDIPALRFIDSEGRVFGLDYGRVRGEYILREVISTTNQE